MNYGLGGFKMSKEDDKKEDKLGLVELENFKNLVDLAARSMQSIIHNIKFKDINLYYLQFGGLPGFGTTIYFVDRPEPIKEKYIVYNKTEDTISFSDKLDPRGNLIYIPIIHVKKQNIFSSEELEDFLKK